MENGQAVRYSLMKEPEKMMKTPNADSFKHTAIHVIIGLCVGFAILHPVSMLIDNEVSHFYLNVREFAGIWFSGCHWKMSLYFALLGGAVGIFQGILVRKIVERTRRVLFLERLLPICAKCKRIRVKDKGHEIWVPIERFISMKSNVDYTHGICNECMKNLYPEYAEKIEKESGKFK